MALAYMVPCVFCTVGSMVGGGVAGGGGGASSDTSLSVFTVEGLAATDGGSVNLDSSCIGAEIVASSTEFITSGAGSFLRNDFTGTVGFAFDVTFEITITHLGRWVASGNDQTHEIGIWDSGENLLGSVTVNTAGAPVGYLYVALGSPIVLPVDTDYRIGSHEVSLGDEWYNDFVLSSTGVGSVVSSAFVAGGSLDCPGVNPAGGLKGYVPVNFKYLGRALSIVTTPTDPDATVGTKTIDPSPLEAGENELEFDVTAEDSTVQHYNVSLFTPFEVDLDSSNFAFGGFVTIEVDPNQYFAKDQYLEFVTTAGVVEVKPLDGTWDYYINGAFGGTITGDDTFQEILDAANGSRTIRVTSNGVHHFRTNALRITGATSVSKPANSGVIYNVRGKSYIGIDGGWDTDTNGPDGYGTGCYQTYDYSGGSLRFQGAGVTVKAWILNNAREAVPFFAILYADGAEVDRAVLTTDDTYQWVELSTADASTHEYELRILTRYFNVVQALALITSGGGDGLDTGYSPPARNQIIGLGDSITAATDASLSANDRASMFGLEVALDQELGYINLAVPGYTVADVITQTTGTGPGSIASNVTDIDVMIGTNDTFGTPTADYIDYYGTIISNLRGGFPSAKIRMIGITPRTTNGAAVTALNGYMSDAVDDAADADCIFIDTSSIGINATAGQDTTDGIHLNASGYAKLASAVLATY